MESSKRGRTSGRTPPDDFEKECGELKAWYVEHGLPRDSVRKKKLSDCNEDEKKEKRIRDRLNKYISSAKALLNGETTKAKLHLLWNEDAREHRIKCMLATEVPKLVAILKQL